MGQNTVLQPRRGSSYSATTGSLIFLPWLQGTAQYNLEHQMIRVLTGGKVTESSSKDPTAAGPGLWLLSLQKKVFDQASHLEQQMIRVLTGGKVTESSSKDPETHI